jgi:integrase
LKVRVTSNGSKAFVYEAKLNGRAISRTLGKCGIMSIEDAKARARVLATTVKTDKRDPRELDKQEAERLQQEKAAAEAKVAAEAAEQMAQSLTVGEVWKRYIVEGRPKRKAAWKPRYLADMAKMTAQGGEKRQRGAGLTLPGHLHPLMGRTLRELDEDALFVWFEAEAKRSEHQATRALMMFRGFLRWCSARPEYRALVNREAGRAPAIMERLPEATKRTDALDAAQVAGWWAAVTQLPNPTASVYLRALLLTGARREEMAALKWEHIDFRWNKFTIADKVDATRTLPLTPYLCHLLAGMVRGRGPDGKPSAFVFASTSKTGRLADPRSSHERALREAGIGHLTLHGLRRTFATLGEAAGAPAGALAQLMGHKPSAVHEGYKPRTIDALQPYAAQVEAHILALAGVKFDANDAKAAPGLRVVSAA